MVALEQLTAALSLLPSSDFVTGSGFALEQLTPALSSLPSSEFVTRLQICIRTANTCSEFASKL